jgi:hypothetical protein
MPLPTVEAQPDRDVHVITWPLYHGKDPALEEIKQAPGIANCPVGAILAAHAFTPVGRTILHNMVKEKLATVLTDLSRLPTGTLNNPPSGNSLTSTRFFTVDIPRVPKAPPDPPFEVSDVLYTNDSDSGWELLYLRDPAERAIWGSIIEKALAVRLGSYENFDALNLKVHQFWQLILGARPGQLDVDADTPLTKITDAARAATRVPSIAASNENARDVKFVTEFHGFAMMGLENSKIKLYDAAKPDKFSLSPTDFRHDFQAIFFRK